MKERSKILIVEDEVIVATHLSTILSSHGYDVLADVQSGEDALEFIQDHTPDLILMDVMLGGDLDGIQTAEIIHQSDRKIPIVFLTANADEMTFNRSKKAFPHAFIQKPFKTKVLLRNIELIFHKLQQEKITTPDQPEEDDLLRLEDRIFVRDKSKMVKIVLKAILYVEANRNYCKIQTKDKAYMLSMPLKAFEKKVNSPFFIKSHRSYIVNITKVDAIDDHTLYSEGKSIPMGRNYKNLITQSLNLL